MVESKLSKPREISAGRVALSGAIAYGLAALLCAPDLLRLAERQPIGEGRRVAINVATRWHRFAAWCQVTTVNSRLAQLAHPPPTDPPEAPEPERTPAERSAPSQAPVVGAIPSVSGCAPELRPARNTPVRVYSAGDSMAWVVSQEFARLARRTGRYQVTYDAHHSSGLVRPDYIDWPERVRNALSVRRFDAVLLTFGTNDAERLRWQGELVSPSTPPWNEAYRARVDAMLRLALGEDRHVFWIGLPVMRLPSFSERVRGFNQIFRDATTVSERAVFVDTWQLFGGPDGRYSAWMDLDSGRSQLVRETDGIHYTRLGARLLAERLIDLLDRTYFAARAVPCRVDHQTESGFRAGPAGREAGPFPAGGAPRYPGSS